MKNIWNFLVWKYNRSTRGELFYLSGMVSWIPTWIGMATDNPWLYLTFGGYAVIVFVTGFAYFTYTVLIKQEWDKYQSERDNLFRKIKTGSN